jgi:GT2 family glycosyltransferase
MNPNSITVIIPTYLREEPLRLCLGDLFAQELPATEIIVVDQSPVHEEATTLMLTDKEHHVVWIRHPTPNLPGARNIGLGYCTTDVVLFLDDDARVAPNFVRNHLNNYENPTVMAVAGPVLESLESWVDALPRHAVHPFESRFTSCWQYRYRRRVLHAPGGNMSFRRSILSTTGMFDDHYEGPAFREETDFFLRVTAAGHTIIYDPESLILHKNGPKPGGCWNDAWKTQLKVRAYNEAYFAVKNFPAYRWGFFIWKALRASTLSEVAFRSPMHIPFRFCCTVAGWKRALQVTSRAPIQ